jgi:16S rRNA processing protein RimM
MKSLEPFRLIGKIKEAHGLRGDFYVLVFSGDVSWLKELKGFQLKDPVSGDVYDFSKVSAKPHKQGFILTIEGIIDRTEAEKYHGFHVLIPSDLLVAKAGETIYLAEIENFEVKDADGRLLGRIVGFSSNGAQDLLIVENKTSKAEIPFVEAFTKEINFEGKYLVMDLPEGLFDLNML